MTTKQTKRKTLASDVTEVQAKPKKAQTEQKAQSLGHSFFGVAQVDKEIVCDALAKLMDEFLESDASDYCDDIDSFDSVFRGILAKYTGNEKYTKTQNNAGEGDEEDE